MTNNIEISLGNVIQFNYPDASKLKRVLILGNTKNFFGKPWDEIEKQNENDISNVCFFRDLLENKVSTVIIGEQNGENEEFEYYENLIKELKNIGVDTQNFYKFFKFYATKNDDDYIAYLNELNRRNMKFDYIIQNPPYAGSLHFDIFDKTLDLIDPKGKMTIIEPATWLINTRDKTKYDIKVNSIKEKIASHVYKVIIDRYSKEFNIGIRVPLSITYIDMSNTYNEIEFHCFGEKKYVKSLSDCNFLGDLSIVKSINSKLLNYKDVVSQHVVKKTTNICENMYFLRFTHMLTDHGYNSNVDYVQHKFGSYYSTYSSSVSHKNDNVPVQEIKKNRQGNNWDVLFGAKEELENLVYNNINTKLFCYIQIAHNINNLATVSQKYIPWLVDKQYTDDEINKLFGFTDEEIAFMDRTIAKFERYSPWFKRYMCGPTSVSDKEVQQFCDKLNR